MTTPETPITSTSQLQADGWKGYAKAITGAIIAGLTYLLGVIPASGGFDDVTIAGWLGCVITVLTVGGGVYAIPNAVKPTPPAEVLDGQPGHA